MQYVKTTLYIIAHILLATILLLVVGLYYTIRRTYRYLRSTYSETFTELEWQEGNKPA